MGMKARHAYEIVLFYDGFKSNGTVNAHSAELISDFSERSVSIVDASARGMYRSY